MSKNIVPENYNISRKDREKSLNHPSKVLWFTGLSGSGKSTLANSLEVELHQAGYHTYVLDGDNVRAGLNADLDFTAQGREENLRRIAEVAKLFVDAGIITLAAFISPMITDRNKVREIIGSDNFLEIYIKADLSTCESRDVKGLYKKARKGEIPNFTGISAPYEAPKNPDIIIDTSSQTIEEATKELLSFIIPKLKK